MCSVRTYLSTATSPPRFARRTSRFLRMKAEEMSRESRSDTVWYEGGLAEKVSPIATIEPLLLPAEDAERRWSTIAHRAVRHDIEITDPKSEREDPEDPEMTRVEEQYRQCLCATAKPSPKLS